MSLTFKEYQDRNKKNSDDNYEECKYWLLTDWTNAIAGEAGEACNIAKKVRRGDFRLYDAKLNILSEIADVMVYCSLLCSFLGADLEEEINRKYVEILARQEEKKAKDVSLEDFLGIPIHEPGDCKS